MPPDDGKVGPKRVAFSDNRLAFYFRLIINKLTIGVKKFYVRPSEVNCIILHSNRLLLFPYSSQHKFCVQLYLVHASVLAAFLSVMFILDVSFY